MSAVFAVRLPKHIKAGLAETARRHHLLNSQELVRLVLGQLVNGELMLVVKNQPTDRVKPTDVDITSKRSRKRRSKAENLDKLRHLLEEDPSVPVIRLATILRVKRQTVYNYKKELKALEADSNEEVK